LHDPGEPRPRDRGARERERRARTRQRRRSRLVDAVAIAGLAVVALLVGLCTSLGQARFITLDGRAVVVSAGTTLASMAKARDVALTAGAKVDLIGDVRLPSGGQAGHFEIAGAPASATAALHDGDVVTSRRGADVAEAVAIKTEELPFRTITQGDGSVIALAVRGSAGERRSVLGVDSKRIGLRVTVKTPVNQVVRRTGNLSEGQKAVALTFDDGPSVWTSKVFAVLQAKGAKGTFFFVGRNVSGRGKLVDQARSLGFEVETHGWSHSDLTKLSADAAKTDISKGLQAVGGASFLRPPYGNYNATVIAVASALGLRLALWNVDTLDWQSHNADAILAKVKAQTRAGSIILMHDGGGDRSATVAALPRVIDWLLQQGYALTTVSRLTGAPSIKS
jgi:peptidoglycan/xylan/chitin deacetylase (PgdA/CDA1 family)